MGVENDLYALMGDKPNTGQVTERWCINMEAIVAINEDPENRHRIKCVIPSIDENKIHDKWIDRLLWWTGGAGYGDFHTPGIGSEVRLFGRTGMKHNLSYMSVYNENFIVPADFRRSTVRGFRTDGDYKQIADLDFQIRAGRLELETDATITMIAPGGLYFNNKRIG